MEIRTKRIALPTMTVEAVGFGVPFRKVNCNDRSSVLSESIYMKVDVRNNGYYVVDLEAGIATNISSYDAIMPVNAYIVEEENGSKV